MMCYYLNVNFQGQMVNSKQVSHYTMVLLHLHSMTYRKMLIQGAYQCHMLCFSTKLTVP